jgi:FkbM family methyltransferase
MTSRYPLNTPRASILSRLPAIPSAYGEFRGKRGARYRGYWMSDDEVCRSLFWFGDFDPWVNLTLSRLARPGSVALDVGANIGATALTLAKAVGPQGRVFCFEPMPSNIVYLRQNIAANDLTWVQVEPVALSDKGGELSMILPADHAGMSRVVADANDQTEFRVRSTTFDDWLETQPKLDISVCKIDVEGHEAEVFAGMKKALSNRVVPAFVFERHIGSEVRSDPIFELLASNGYRLLRIEKGLVRVLYVDVADPPKARPTRDFIAILPGDALRSLNG